MLHARIVSFGAVREGLRSRTVSFRAVDKKYRWPLLSDQKLVYVLGKSETQYTHMSYFEFQGGMDGLKIEFQGGQNSQNFEL